MRKFLPLLLLLALGCSTDQMIEKRWERLFNECTANVETLGKAVEAYAEKNEGEYPSKLQDLAPTYVDSVPPCPFTTKDNYAYHRGEGEFKVYCKGDVHKGLKVPKDHPQYTQSGLKAR